MRAGSQEDPLESPETGLSDETSLAEGERPGYAPLRASLPPPHAAGCQTARMGVHGVLHR
jgi:hypothetical protein